MCFTIKENKRKKADRNIRVWKIIGVTGSGTFYNLTINHEYESWTEGYEYIETKPFVRSIIYENAINGGCFHSGKTRENARGLLRLCGNGYKIVQMIIPKGAEYYENDIEYVSNRIIYPKQNEIKEWL